MNGMLRMIKYALLGIFYLAIAPIFFLAAFGKWVNEGFDEKRPKKERQNDDPRT